LSFALLQQADSDCRRLHERKVHNLGQRHSHLDGRPFFAFSSVCGQTSGRIGCVLIILSHLLPRSPPVASARALLTTEPNATLAPSSKDQAAELTQTLRHAIVIIPSAHSTPHSSSYDSPTTRLMPFDRHVSTQRSSLPPYHQ
jgi:hypothetical protein